jgi:hypothetical protein
MSVTAAESASYLSSSRIAYREIDVQAMVLGVDQGNSSF